MTVPVSTPAPDTLEELAFGGNIAAGTYPGVVLAVEPVRIDTADEPAKPLLRWTFAIDVDGTGEEIDALSSRNTSPRSKPYAWTAALLGRVPTAGERIKLADLSGRKCLVSVELDDNGYPKVAAIVAAPKPAKAPAT
jgi:hypothetical protein